jgi:subfamily B ATP-binding cassette protein MsbA
MIKQNLKKIKVVSDLIRLHDFWHRIGMKFNLLFIPVFLSLIASLFEGLNASLLIPIVKGVIKMDFGFARDIPVFKFILQVSSYLFQASNTSIFVLLIMAFFTALVLKNIFNYAAALTLSYQMRKFTSNLREAIFSRYLSFGKLFFDRTSEGHLHNQVLNFTNAIASYFQELRWALSNFFVLIIYIVLMLIISFRMTVFSIILSPLFFFSLRWLIKKIKTSSKFYTSAQADLSKKLFNVLSCIPLVKAYSAEERERNEFSAISDKVRRLEFSIDKKYFLIGPTQEILLSSVIIILIFAVAFMVVKEKKEVAMFLVYFYILKRAVASFNSLAEFKGRIAALSGVISNILNIFDDRDKFFVPEGKREFTGLQSSIKFRDLNFSYIKERTVLNDISFSIEQGKVAAIVGPTGSGKTTLINLILRFYDCPPASIFIDETDIREFTLKSLRANMALVSQEVYLFNDSLKNNIAYGLERPLQDEELIEVLKKARLYDFVVSLPDGFNTLVGDRGIQLSGGEKQRVSIARALLKGSEILILDEATSSLDTRTEQLIQQAIAEAIRGRTSIVIAHRLSTIKNADKIVVIEEGKFIEEGSMTDLLARKGKFYQYWEAQKFY